MGTKGLKENTPNKRLLCTALEGGGGGRRYYDPVLVVTGSILSKL